MKRLVALASTFALAAGLLLISPATASAAGCGRPKVLPSISAQAYSQVLGLDGRGRIAVGASEDVPVYWQDGVLRRVPLAPGLIRGGVLAVNESGLMVGWMTGALSDPEARYVAFQYRPGQDQVALYPEGYEATDINNAGYATVNVYSLTSDYTYVYGPGRHVARRLTVAEGDLVEARGINDSGRVVGTASVPGPDGSLHPSAVTWSAQGSVRELSPSGDRRAFVNANGIDDRGRVVGGWLSYLDERGTYGLFWPSVRNAGRRVPLQSLNAISPTGHIMVGTVGANVTDGTYEGGQAAVWRGTGAPTTLPGLAPGARSEARAVDRDGRVGGAAVDAQGATKPVVWRCTTGGLTS